MTERKVLNKYFPPDFDPSVIPRRRQPITRQQTVRLMAPFSMRCTTCGEFIYKGKKFNARKEAAEGEMYYGIQIFRFYIKCTLCSSEITFKTDPKNTDYQAEHGAQRNFEPWREDEDEKSKDRLDELEEEEEAENNPMKMLENKTNDSKLEMEIMDKLQEIRTRNARMDKVDKDEILLKTVSSRVSKGKGREDEDEQRKIREEAERLLDEEDEALVRRYFHKKNGNTNSASTVAENDEEGDHDHNHDHDHEDKTTSTTLKRDITEVEPDAKSLLSERAKKMGNVWKSETATASESPSTLFSSGVKKRKDRNKNSMAAKMGIKIKSKT